MTGTDQVGAPVLCSSASLLAPGEGARVVIIPPSGAYMAQWRLLDPGDALRMFEGPCVCGHATVRWTEHTSRPVPACDQARFCAWTDTHDDRPRL